jgi:hypothetical protein
MLPVEVAGGIKGNAVNPGCEARFSFVSVKASPKLETISCNTCRSVSSKAASSCMSILVTRERLM